MKRVPGAWRQTWTFSRVTSVGRLEPLVDERAQHREQQRHQQRRRAALAGDVAERDHQRGRRRAAGCRRSRRRRCWPAGSCRRLRRRARVKRPRRQHRLLDLARDLEIVLERQPVGDFEQHQQVHQHERDEQRPACRRGTAARARRRRRRTAARRISMMPTPRNRLTRPIEREHAARAP